MSKKIILGCVIAGLLFLAVAFFPTRKREAIIITTYASVAEVSLDDLIAKADMIVVGEFSAIQPSRWSTSNGKLPANATVDYVSEHHLRIFSDSPFHISAYLKGDNRSPVIRVRTFGGQVEQDSMVVSGEPVYVANQPYLLFLYYNTGTTAEVDPGAYYGSYIYYELNDGHAVSRKDTWLLEDLIAYIENSLFNETSLPTEVPVLIDTPTTIP